jgi:selenocysteine lyase/cysteine desulfurase
VPKRCVRASVGAWNGEADLADLCEALSGIRA